jgi:mono/diheme cytochrome c family protein
MSAKSNWISLLFLMVLVIVLPVYAAGENDRMSRSQEAMRAQSLQEGMQLYVRYCAVCHGADGAGIGAMPALNNPALAAAEPTLLQKTIARAVHGSAMAAWHIQEGGALNDYQINQLVDLIRWGDWQAVQAVALASGFEVTHAPEDETGMAYLFIENEDDPHRCVSCHEDPLVHRNQFGVNCARCHSSVSWKPAFLTRHTFMLDHGGDGAVACQTCHAENYYTYTCYGCHDHAEQDMQEVHEAEKLADYQLCADCHPTGQSGEARQLMQVGALGDRSADGLAQAQRIFEKLGP